MGKIDLSKLLDAGREVLDAIDGDPSTTIPEGEDAPEVPAAQAEGPPSSAPLVGAGAGAALGFVVGGPVGALVGAVAGWWLGPKVAP